MNKLSVLQIRSALVPIFVFLIFPLAWSGNLPETSGDLLLLNAHVVTMDSTNPSAEAVAIRDERIVWVGSNVEGRRRFAATHRSIDLHGSTVLPGIIDAHTHLTELGKSLLRLNLKGVATEQEVVELVKRKVASSKPGDWILGWGWDEGSWASHYPSNDLLNTVSPNNPVYLVGLHGFAAWANKRAMTLAEVNHATKNPENGTILRDPKSGEPTGILLNRAQELVEQEIPPLSIEEVKKAIEVAGRECVRNGLTSVHEAKVSRIMIQAFRELIAENRLPLRVYVILDGSDPTLVKEWLERGPEIDPHHQLTIRSFKLFADGALGSRGAALEAPYSDAAQTNGLITTPESEVYGLTRHSLEKGFQVCTHAIGDAANHMVLDAYGRAMGEVPQAHDPRLRIEHAQVLAPEDILRFAKLDVIASMQPTHCTSDMGWAEKRLGPERVKGAYAWKSVLKTGAHVPLSSDFPGESLNPFYGIYAAITRQDPSGNPPAGWYPEQRLTLQEAMRGYTIEAAYAEFEEGQKGSIEPGKLADFTVISGDITKLPAKDILSLRVLKTFIGGKLVYDSDREN